MYLTGLILTILLLIAPNSAAASDDVLAKEGNSDVPVVTLRQWQRVVEDYAFQSSFEPSKKIYAWKRFMSSVESEEPLGQLLKVNLWFNGFPYKQDNWVYGEDDYWATPSEFLENGGDCEDFAIIKYITLRLLGFPAESMKIAMVYDVFSGTDHSFLIVNYEGEDFVLDNRENMTVADHYVDRYKPHYAFNEQKLWMFDSPLMVEKLRKDDSGDVLPGNR